jgi:hypothetical protein
MPIYSPDVFDSVGDAVVIGGSGGGGVSTFVALNDTPASYSGQAGKVVKVNGAENALIFEDGTGNVTPISAAFASVALMVADTNIVDGQTVATYGYYNLNDGGQMVYTVTDTDLSADVDGGSVIALANSLYAQAQFPPYYRPEMWGAKGDNNGASADINVSALTAMFNHGRDVSNKAVYFSGGKYFVNEAVPFYKPIAGVNYGTGYYVIHGNGTTIQSTGRSTTCADTFTVQTGEITLNLASSTQRWQVGERVKITDANSRYCWMAGEVTAISGSALTVDVDETNLFMRRGWNSRVNFALGSQRITYVSAVNQFRVGQTVEAIFGGAGHYGESSLQYVVTMTVTGANNNFVDVDVTDLGGSVITETLASSNATISTGVKRFQGFANASRLTGGVIVRCEYDASNYVEGIVTFVDSSASFYLDVTTAVGSGTYSTWTATTVGLRNFDLQVTANTASNWLVKGGINIFDRSIEAETATSITSQALTTGSKTFTYVPTSTAFYAVSGRSLQVRYDADNYMTGSVTAYDPNARTVTVNITSVVGSGTYADWVLTINAMYVAERSVASKFDIRDLSFTGQGLEGYDVGLRYACSYGSRMVGGAFNNCHAGFWGEFNLMANYSDAILGGCYYGARFDKGNWYGASGSNSQSNVANIVNYRTFGNSGSVAGVYIKASNSYWMQNYIHEGAPSLYGVLFQRFGSPNVTVFTMDDVHLEVTCYQAFYKAIDDGSMNITLDRVYPQYSNVIADTASDFTYNTVYWVAGSTFIGRSDNFFFPAPYNAMPAECLDLTSNGYKYWGNGQVPFYGTGDFGLTQIRKSRNGVSLIDGSGNSLNVSSNLVYTQGGSALINAGSAEAIFGRAASGYFKWNTNQGVFVENISPGRNLHISQNPTGNPQGIIIRTTSTGADAKNSRIQIHNQTSIGGGFAYQYSLPRAGGADGTVMKLSAGTAGGATENLVNFGYVDFIELGDVSDTSYAGLTGAVPVVNAGATGMSLLAPSTTPGQVLKSTGTDLTYSNTYGQVIALEYNTTTATIPIPSAAMTPFPFSIRFFASATTMLIEMNCYVTVGSGETISSGLSTGAITFADVGSTVVLIADNGSGGSHDISFSIAKTWQVTGLTVGTEYVYYASFQSTGSGSDILVGVNVSPFVLKALHGAV